MTIDVESRIERIVFVIFFVYACHEP